MTPNNRELEAVAEAEKRVVDAILIHFNSHDRTEAERWFGDQAIPAYGMMTLREVARKYGADEAIGYLDCLKYGVA